METTPSLTPPSLKNPIMKDHPKRKLADFQKPANNGNLRTLHTIERELVFQLAFIGARAHAGAGRRP